MNFFDCEVAGGGAVLAGHPVRTANPARAEGRRLQLGVRPEFISFAPDGIPVRITHVADAGRFSVVEAQGDAGLVRLLVQEGAVIPAEAAHVRFDPAHTLFYSDGWLVQ
jgi:glycerol transport system ATP-binding protein